MNKTSKSMGLYGGTFNPVHLGHLNLAAEMLEAHQLDEILFCPARLNPHKSGDQGVSAEHRLNMLKLAIEGNPKFSISDFELNRPAPSYTIDTVEHLLSEEKKKKHPRQLYLIIGEDSLIELHRWHRVEELIKLVPLLVGQRSTHLNQDTLKASKPIKEAIAKGYTNTKIFEISSTDARERLSRGKYCGHLIPQKVLDYIYTNDLYFTCK